MGNTTGIEWTDWAQIARPGKKEAGSLLDGLEWKQFPEGF
jgi:hypothetical protein